MLNRVPFWGWFLIILGVLNAIYSPSGLSVYHMWTTTEINHLLPVKILLSVILVALLGLVLNGVRQSMSLLGLIVLLALIAVPLWVVHYYTELDLLNAGFWSWVSQPIAALILTIGWQWRKIWRSLTGIVGVEDTAAHE